MTQLRSRKPAAQERAIRHRTRALRDWIELQMADPVAAQYALRVVGMHGGLIAWKREAEQAMLTPAPQRRHPFDDREAGRGARVSGTRNPDDWMAALVDRWIQVGGDPEHLEPTRHRMTHKLGELAGWYLDKTGAGRGSDGPMADLLYLARWEPLAVRLGDLIGDQVAANALATAMLGHHALVITTPTRYTGACHAARARWSRLAGWYVRLLDEQADPYRRAPVESVGSDGQRRIG